MKKTKILIPVFNDWKSLFTLLVSIDTQFYGWDAEVSIIIVNDASTDKRPDFNFRFENIKSVKIINMKKNTGHARCNALGLKYINENEEFDFIIPMDGDGEDRPEEIGALLCAGYESPDKVITANRVKRAEGLFFRFCYFFHKFLTFFFTGQSIKFGNFTCLPNYAVKKMINEPATWSSFSGSVAKILKDRKSIPSTRAERYFGTSKMSFFKLIKHSFSIIAVFKKTFLIRSLLFLLAYLFLILGKISFVTLIPVFGVIVLMISVITLSRRENMSEFNSSLENIEKIDVIK